MNKNLPTTPSAYPGPRRSSKFWDATAFVGLNLMFGIPLATLIFQVNDLNTSTPWIAMAASAAAMAALCAVGVSRSAAASAQEWDAALSNRYRTKITRVGPDRWDIGGTQIAAVLRPGPSLHLLGHEPASN